MRNKLNMQSQLLSVIAKMKVKGCVGAYPDPVPSSDFKWFELQLLVSEPLLKRQFILEKQTAPLGLLITMKVAFVLRESKTKKLLILSASRRTFTKMDCESDQLRDSLFGFEYCRMERHVCVDAFLAISREEGMICLHSYTIFLHITSTAPGPELQQWCQKQG